MPQEDQAVRGRTLATAMVSLEVESYDRWKTALDAEPETRRRAGIVGHAVHRSAIDPSEVVVYVQAESAERLRAFFASSELATRMRKGGVSNAASGPLLRGHVDPKRRLLGN